MTRRLLVLLLALAPALIVRASERAEELVLATYKLANKSSTATGLAVSLGDGDGERRIFLVTARHVFDQMEGNRFQLVSRKREDNGTYTRAEHSVPLRDGDTPLWTAHHQHDLAVLPVPGTLAIRSLPIDCLAGEEQIAKVRTGDALRLAVFPERSEANGAGFPILRNGTIASFPFTPHESHPVFLVDTTAWMGDSGGPVMHGRLTAPGGGPLVVGVVRGMRHITDTEKESRFVERKVNYPLGVSEVLHAAFARELIRKAADGG